MRIAVLCTDQGIRIPDDGKGAAIHLLAITRAFQRLGHEVVLVGVAGHGPAPEGIECLLFEHPGRSFGLDREHRKLALTEHIATHAAGPLARFAPDLLYERLALFGTAGAHLAARLGCAHVLEVNALLAREEAEWRGLQLGAEAQRRERCVVEGAQLCVAVSDELERQIREVSPSARTLVVPNGVEAARFAVLPSRSDARAQLGLPTAAPLAVFVGSLRAWHGLEIAIGALVAAPMVHLVVAGDGSAQPALAAHAAALGVAARVHWLGHKPHDEIPLVLAAADLALAPYPALATFAFSPLKLYEYLAAGLPVVASDLGQVRAVLDEHGGVLVPPGDATALAAALTATLGDLDRHRSVAHHARGVVLRTARWEDRAGTILEASHALAG